MRLIIFGAAGQVGRRLVAEAARRGHAVAAVVRREPEPGLFDASVTIIRRDVLAAADLADVISGHDVALTALRPPDGDEPALVPMTASVVDAARATGVRFIVIGGAAAMLVPDAPGHTVLTAPGFLPDAIRPIATASQWQHDWCIERLPGAGAYLAPPAMLTPGDRTGAYRIGSDTLVTNGDGRSHISIEDFAVAAIDEAEQGSHTGLAFTVGY